MTAQAVIEGLVRRGLPPHVAYGVAGNMQVESDGFKTDVNEYAPLIPGSRGGYGLNQWTGPRRRQFEAFAAERGKNPADLDTQLDFTMWELQNTEKAAGQALLQAGSVAEAAQIYSQKFLRPGIPHLERRVAAAERLAGGGFAGAEAPAEGYTTGNYVDVAQGGAQAQKNAMTQEAEPQQMPQINQLALYENVMPTQGQMPFGGFTPETNPFLSYLRGA